MRKPIIIAILVTGLSGIVAQILLLRELLIAGFGNELSIGIILANWLILESLGAFFVGRSIERVKKKVELFVGLVLLFSLSFPAAIIASRIFKEFLGITTGEGLGLVPMFYSSFLILLPVSLSHGALFTFGCKIYSLYSQEDAKAIGRVYIYETLGTIAGGIIFTYLLVLYFHSLQIAIGVGLLNLLVCLLILRPLRPKATTLTAKVMAGVSVIFLIFYSYIIFTPGADLLHWSSVEGQWKGQRLLHYQNSIYGNVAVTQSAEQYTFYSDGLPVITTPTPERAFVEELAHLPLLFHPRPEQVLVISGGAGGIINEALKHPSLQRLDYVELDPLILEVLREFPTPLTETELNDARVNVQYIDGRLFVKRTAEKYDLVLVGISDPQDLQLNRLFTEEFFSEASRILKEEGILVVSLPGSLSYLSEELKDLNACILNTLKRVYPYVRIIPGEGLNLYLASASSQVSLTGPAGISRRLKERGLKEMHLLTPAYLEYKLDPRRLNWLLKSLTAGTEKTNRDFSPLGLFYSLSYWNALFSPYMRSAFRWFEKMTLSLFLILFSCFTLVFLVLRLKIKSISRVSIPLCITTSGFAGMLFDLALIFSFQVLYGYVFYWLGILVTAFMAGVVAGGWGMTRALGRIKRDLALFLKLELALVIFSLILPLVFTGLSPYLGRPAGYLLLQAAFLVLSFLSGALIGAEFPLANKIYLAPPLFSAKTKQGDCENRQKSLPKAIFLPAELSATAGLLYGADLFGGWIGGILGGVVLLPVLGLMGTCIVVAMLKLSSLIILAASAKEVLGK